MKSITLITLLLLTSSIYQGCKEGAITATDNETKDKIEEVGPHSTFGTLTVKVGIETFEYAPTSGLIYGANDSIRWNLNKGLEGGPFTLKKVAFTEDNKFSGCPVFNLTVGFDSSVKFENQADDCEINGEYDAKTRTVTFTDIEIDGPHDQMYLNGSLQFNR